jgi:hypothetical protein
MAVRTPKLSPTTPLPGLNATLGDFWSWAYSDVLSNGNRSVYAEFLVASALGVTALPRKEWDMVDLRYRGKKIEVKASAFAQTWASSGQPSVIRFDIRKKLPWDSETNLTGTTPIRVADCFVFCWYPEADRLRAVSGVLDATEWRFYVLTTEEIEKRFGNQKSIRLATLATVCTDGPVGYDRLRELVDARLGSGQ